VPPIPAALSLALAAEARAQEPPQHKVRPAARPSGRRSAGRGSERAAIARAILQASTSAIAGRALPPSTFSGLSPDSRALALRAASVIVSRAQFAAQAGLTFVDSTGTALRDIYLALGYPRVLTVPKYVDRYLRGDIAKTIVEAHPKATWMTGAELVESSDPAEETPFENAARLLARRIKMWETFLRADILAGIGEYGVIYIGAPGKPDEPLTHVASPEKIAYLTALGQDRALVEKSVTDATDPRFGQPEFYSLAFAITTNSVTPTASTTPMVRVHHSRVIHVADGLLANEVFGQPRLQAVWNRLDDIEKLVGGGSEAAWKRMDPGVQAALDPDLEMDPTDEDALSDEVQEFIHGYTRFITTRGVDLKQFPAQIANFGPNVTAVLQLISSTMRIPLRILIGSERGEQASSQDRNNWNDEISFRRLFYAAPLVRSFIDRMISLTALPKVDEYEIVWPEAQEMSETEKAQSINSVANANKANVIAGNGIIVDRDEMRRAVYGLGPLAESNPDAAAIGAPAANPDGDTLPPGSTAPPADPQDDNPLQQPTDSAPVDDTGGDMPAPVSRQTRPTSQPATAQARAAARAAAMGDDTVVLPDSAAARSSASVLLYRAPGTRAALAHAKSRLRTARGMK